ncbi:MAG: hypothetical protein SF069_07350 [Phycisphaerae bacterium]|nr:hypothetical protein [Phycisphaerae bacterium]
MLTKQIALAALLAMLVFVTPASVLADCPGDMNSDNLLDFVDVEAFLGCMLGPDVPLDPGCEPGDIDLDADADMADFAAVQVAFGTSCDPQEIVLRDSIGGDNTSTNGNRWYTSQYEDFISKSKSDVMVLQGLPNSNVKLTSLRGIVSGINLNFSMQDWNIGVWSSENAILVNSHHGDVTNASFDTPTSGPNVYGQDLLGGTTYEVQFDISAANIVIPAGQSIFIGLQAQAYDISYSGTVGIMESTELGNQEKQYYDQWPGGWCYTDDPNCFSAVHYDGRFAIEVRGVVVP